ncbi:deoxyinosine 3'endonuclease (Endonuclease V) [Desulfosarcina variabilis str. Montpellier]|uniref:endonuclease V n=1 Tax=Desulfosarcina variabilis TaxID=2300 RepID=UPI003AFAF09E
MILAVDVYYHNGLATIGGVTFSDWTAEQEDAAYQSTLQVIEDYVPGQFYRRELPCILHLLNAHKLAPDTIVVDGFVYLDGFCLPGLGKHLFDALNGQAAVIGVAKRKLAQTPDAVKIYRGQSKTPLFVTSVGISLASAKAFIVSMHGPYRIPSLLKRVDQISRTINDADLCWSSPDPDFSNRR